MAEGRIDYEVRDQVGLITINKPETLNSVTVPMLGLLGDVIAQVRHDEAVRCVILTGAGRGFCSGTDISGGRAQTGGHERAMKAAQSDAALSRRRPLAPPRGLELHRPASAHHRGGQRRRRGHGRGVRPHVRYPPGLRPRQAGLGVH